MTASPSGADLSFSLNDAGATLTLTYNSKSISLKASIGTWLNANDRYSYSGALAIDGLSRGQVPASIGKTSGVSLQLSGGINFGGLALDAGEIDLQIRPGSEINNSMGFITFDDQVIYADISSSINLEIGSDTKIALPSLGNISAFLFFVPANGDLYYEELIPAPTTLANGVSKLISPKSKGSVGGFGYSVGGDFNYQSSYDVYKSSGSVPQSVSFSANAVLMGEYDLASTATVDGTFFLNTSSG